jgi:hypothetical protein
LAQAVGLSVATVRSESRAPLSSRVVRALSEAVLDGLFEAAERTSTRPEPSTAVSGLERNLAALASALTALTETRGTSGRLGA